MCLKGLSRRVEANSPRAIISFLFLAVSTLVPSTATAQNGPLVEGVVGDTSGQPIEGAVILAGASSDQAVSGADGSYRIELPAGSYLMLATAEGFEVGEARVELAEGETATINFNLKPYLSQFGEQVVVIGSRAERTALETAVPVDVLAREEFEDSAHTETSRLIQFLAPSFNHSTSTISDGTDIVRPSTLRGLGPDQTLVLVNGRRRHNSALVHVNGSIGRGAAGVDLNAIPSSAIERVEVLRDGASAQYGSDAIAGVMNLELSSRTGQTRINITGGRHFEGDGEVLQASLNRGWKIGAGGFFNLTLEYRDRGATNRAGEDPRRIFNFIEQQFGQPALASGTPDPREETYDRINHRYGDASSENAYLFINSEFPLSENSWFYLFGGASQRTGESAGFNRLPSQSRTNLLIHPDGHLPLINTNVDDASISTGLRSTFGRWELDTSVTAGSNDFELMISNSANTSLGANSPTSANAGTLSFDQTIFNLDLFGALGKNRNVNLAVGFEARQDQYEIRAGDPASYVDGFVPDQFGGRAPAGIQVFPGFRPSNAVDETRENFAMYTDLEFQLGERFLVGLAGRYEDYSDFGDNLSGKIAMRLAVTDSFALRGAASSGFRAPSLHQSNFNNISTQFVLVNNEIAPLEVGTFRHGSAVTEAFGVPALKEETSTNYSFGFTTRPRPGLSITADVFQIDIEDRIVISGQFRAVNAQIAPLLDPLGVNAAQFFTNAIDTQTRGADVVVAYTRPVGGGGTLSLTGAANWNETEVVGNVGTPAPLAGLGETLFNRIERNYIERGQPRELYNFGLRYSRGRFSSLARINKFGSVVTVESANDPSIDQRFSSKLITDLELAYKFVHGFRFAIGGTNVFDVLPDENRPEISFNGIFVYPRRSAPFGFNGGYYYSRISFVF